MRELAAHLDISIHALHEESDGISLIELTSILISIHALHEESDTPAVYGFPICIDFNPRSP